MREIPLKDKLAGSIRRELLESGLRPGARLSSEKDFATRFGVSHLTIRGSLGILEQEGLVERRPSSGTFIRRLPVRKARKKEGDDRLIAMALRAEGHFFAELYHAISLSCQQRGLIPLAIPFESEGENGIRHFVDQLKAARNRGCRRIMLEKNQALWNPPLSDELGLRNTADKLWDSVVWFGIHQGLPAFIRGKLVCTDYEDLLQQAVRILSKAGKRRICLLTRPPPPRPSFPEDEWCIVNSFSRVMTQEGLGASMIIKPQGDDRGASVDELVELFKSPGRPDAIVASIDYRAVMALEAAGLAGLKVPEELAIIGDYDTPWSHAHGLSSFSRNPTELARRISEMAADGEQCHHPNASPVAVKATFIARASCPMEASTI